MIKKKPYEKQNMKTLYDNQGELIRKQSDFSNYGLGNEYGFGRARLDAKLQARNIIPFKPLSEFQYTQVRGRIDVDIPTGTYLITGCWTSSVSTNVTVSLGGDTLITVSGNQLSLPVTVREQMTLSFIPSNNTGTWTYNLIFISL